MIFGGWGYDDNKENVGVTADCVRSQEKARIPSPVAYQAISEFMASFAVSFTRFDQLDDGTLIEALSYLEVKDLSTAACIDTKFEELGGSNTLWEPMCTKRWRKFYRWENWIGDASNEKKTTEFWKRQFIEKEKLLYHDLGIFAMRADGNFLYYPSLCIDDHFNLISSHWKAIWFALV